MSKIQSPITLAGITAVAFALAGLGCGAPKPAPVVVRASELGQGRVALAPGQSLVIELEPGDEIPLDVRIEGPLVASPTPAEPIRLKVLRHFYLRVDGSGLATSLDGKTFGNHAVPGTFRAGVGATRERGVFAEIVVRTPTPR